MALRSAKLLTEKYGIPIEDIIFDPLVFPVGTGDKNYIGSGAETIEGVRLIKEAFHGVRHFADERGVPNRIAALAVGIARVDRTMRWRGLYA